MRHLQPEEDYARVVKRHTRSSSTARWCSSPGRLIVGNAEHAGHAGGALRGNGDGKDFVIVDAAMNDLIRPTLYEAHHDVKPVTEPAAGRAHITPVGRPCMRERRFPWPRTARWLRLPRGTFWP